MKTIRSSGLALCPGIALVLVGCSSGPPTDVFRAAADLFAPRVDLAVGAEPKALAIVDLDGDGRKDVVVARATGSGGITVLFGNGDGTFRVSNVSNQAGDTPYALAVADLDKDGALDVAVANFFGSEAAVLFGMDFGTRLAVAASGSHPYSLGAADLDGNGSVDLVTSNQVGNSLSVFLNRGQRNISTPVAVSLNGAPGGLAIADLDGDGQARLDVAVALPDSNRVRVLHGQGGGAFAADKVTDLPVGAAPLAVAAGLIDGDGATDLAVTNVTDGTVSVLLASQGSFSPSVSYPTGMSPASLAIGDVDGDGHADIVVGNRLGASISVLRGQTGGKLSPAGELQAGMQPESVAIGDLNGDGLGDVAVANLNSDSVSIFLAKPAAATK